MVNLVYQNDETPTTWKASGGSHLLTLTSLANGAGRQGVEHDFGTGARARQYVWRLEVQMQATPTLGAAIEVYAKTGDTISDDNDDGDGDIAVSAIDKLKNLKLLGLVICDQAAAAVKFSASGLAWLPDRTFVPVIWNAMAAAVSTTAAESFFSLTAVPDEVQ